MHLADEVFDHLFGNSEIGDDTVTHRADRLDAAGCAADHQLGLFANRQYLFLAVTDMVGHHRRFVQYNALALYIDKRVCRAEIHCHIGRKQPAECSEHSVFPYSALESAQIGPATV